MVKEYWKLYSTLINRSRCLTVYKYLTHILLEIPIRTWMGETELKNEKCCFLMSRVFSVSLQYLVILICQNDKKLIMLKVYAMCMLWFIAKMLKINWCPFFFSLKFWEFLAAEKCVNHGFQQSLQHLMQLSFLFLLYFGRNQIW